MVVMTETDTTPRAVPLPA